MKSVPLHITEGTVHYTPRAYLPFLGEERFCPRLPASCLAQPFFSIWYDNKQQILHTGLPPLISPTAAAGRDHQTVNEYSLLIDK